MCSCWGFFSILKKQPKKGGGNHRNALQITEHAVVLGPWTDNEENKKNSSEIIMAFFFWTLLVKNIALVGYKLAALGVLLILIHESEINQFQILPFI